MTRKITLILSLLLFLTSSLVFAQQNFNSIEIAPFVGITMFSVKPNEIKGNFWGGEAVYHLNLKNNHDDWVNDFKVRDISFALSYRHMDGTYLVNQPGSEGFLGNTYGITSRLNIHILNIGKTQLSLIPGFGFTYATESFYTDGNPLIGSHINFSAQAGFKFIRPVSSSVRLLAGMDIYHYSNAAVKLPNDGVNSLNGSLGIDYNIGQPAPPNPKHPFKFYNKNSFEFGIGAGKRGLVQDGGGLTGAALTGQRNGTSHLYQSGLYAGYNYRVSPVFSLKAGSDAVFYYTAYDVNNFYATFQERGTSYNRVRVGAALGFDLWLGRVAFEANYGHYIHYASYYNENWYWTFGGKYFFNSWLGVEAKQYLHGTEANFASFGFLFKVY